MKYTDKQFKEALQSPTYTRSMVKRWKRGYYRRPRTESILEYLNRLLEYKLDAVRKTLFK